MKMIKKIFNLKVAFLVTGIDLALFFAVPWRSSPWSFETGCCGDSICLALCVVHFSVAAKAFLSFIGVTFFSALFYLLGVLLFKIVKFFRRD